MTKYILILISLLASLTVMADEPAARLEVVNNNVDFGALKADAEVQHAEVTIRNTGDAPLKIMRVFGDCSCSAGKYEGGELAPGDSATIKVSFNPKGRQPGEFVKTVKIRSNAVNPIARIYMRGHIKRNLCRQD